MSRKQLYVALGLVVLLLIGGGTWYFLGMFGNGGNSVDTASTASGPNFAVGAHEHTMGNPKAKVTLIEYGALVCPHCAEFNIQNFPQLKAEYIDTGKVFYVYRMFAIRPDDVPAEKLARCLPEDKYFSFVDLLYRNQPKWDAAEYQVPDEHAGFVLMGRIAGLSADQVDKCINSTAEDDAINKVGTDGEAKYGLTGTPTFVVDGTPMDAGDGVASSYDDLKKVLDAHLAAAK